MRAPSADLIHERRALDDDPVARGEPVGDGDRRAVERPVAHRARDETFGARMHPHDLLVRRIPDQRRRRQRDAFDRLACLHDHVQRLADRERKMRKGREGAGTKLIADECGVSEQSVRDWKRHPKGLRWNVERKISKSRSDRLFKRLSDPDFGLFPSLEKRASRDGKKPKLVREPGRASSPSRPTSPARGAVTASQSNIIELGDRARRIIGKVGDAAARAVAAIRLKKAAKQ